MLEIFVLNAGVVYLFKWQTVAVCPSLYENSRRDDLIGRGYWQTTRASQLVYIYQQPEVILHGVKMS